MKSDIKSALSDIFEDKPLKITVSKPPKNSVGGFRRVVLVKKSGGYQAEKYTEKQVFHENLPDTASAEDFCRGLLDSGWGQLNACGEVFDFSLLLSKKGTVTLVRKRRGGSVPQAELSHNRTKNYLIPEDKPFPALVDMGIFTKEGKVVKSMYDKFRQINRFAEIIDDAVREKNWKDRPVRVVDFGCGKSYLTFVLYHYFTEIAGLEADMLGLDLKADVIEKCREAAARYGYSGLRFEVGDIAAAGLPKGTDIVVTLHACDTATDYALYNAVKSGAEMIFSVPCCQHELNGQMKTDNFSVLTRYGIVKERVAALCTDAIRANLLEYCGYRTQLLEFIDFEHTPKNILIRAVKRRGASEDREKYLAEAQRLMEEFSFSPTLYRLLKDDVDFSL